MEKKREKLGINPSTARNRLIKTLLFELVVKSGHKCYRCNGELTLDTFSIEHIEPWLNSEEPVELFFDTNNIAYSHLYCNSLAGSFSPRMKRELTHGTSGYRHGCRCETCKSIYAEARALKYRKRGN